MKLRLLSTISLLVLGSCSGEFVERGAKAPDIHSPKGGPVTVGVVVGDGNAASMETRASAAADGLGTVWDEGDKIVLRAIDSSGKDALAGREFKIYGIGGDRAVFTAELPSEMPEGNYTYTAFYPVPELVEGTRAYYDVPFLQDGAGAEIMYSDPVEGSALRSFHWSDYENCGPQLEMNHLLHRLRFYVTDASALAGEDVEELRISFPRNVAGRLAVDMNSPESAVSVSNGRPTIDARLSRPLKLSGPEGRNYANVTLIPSSFREGESMAVDMYTHSRHLSATIPLKSRTFAAGHSTPVLFVPESVKSSCRLVFNLLSNSIGEPVNTVTVTAPSGVLFPNGSNVFVYTPDSPIVSNDIFEIEFSQQDSFLALSGKDLTVDFDTEHFVHTKTVSVGNLAGLTKSEYNLSIPWLLNENFSAVGSFSSYDEYKTSSAGSHGPYTFLDGWSGGRIGAQAGCCIRIACRRETSVDYDARVDSAPLTSRIKKAVDLDVDFDYGANNRYGGIYIHDDDPNPDVGQNCRVGYIQTLKNYESGDTNGTYESGNRFYVKEYTGSYTNTPNHAHYTIHAAPAGDVFRLSIRTVIEHRAGTDNTTAWLYIDNVTVTISQQ